MATPRAARTARTAPARTTDLLGPARTRARHAKPVRLPRAAGVAGLATVTAVAFLPTSAAVAEPSAADLERRVQSLDVRASTAVEEFRQAEQQVRQAQASAAAAKERAAAEQARLVDARADVAAVVSAAYKRGGNDRLVAVLSDSGPQDFIDRAATLDRIGQSQAEILGSLETAVSRARSQQAAAEAQVEALRAAQRDLEQRRQQVERALAAQQQLLAGVEAQEAQERRRVEAAREAPRVSRSRDTGPAPTYNGPASGRAKVAIDEGYRQLGKPYQYGGSGPDSFDCSGFTSWVWRAAGVSLPRTSRDQYAQGRKVARADVQPGDLLYFGSPIHHVGMYLGDGQMIHAPSSGKTVHITGAWRSDFVGATRP